MEVLKSLGTSKTNMTAILAILLTWALSLGVIDANAINGVETVTGVDVRTGDAGLEAIGIKPIEGQAVTRLQAIYATIAGLIIIFGRAAIEKSIKAPGKAMWIAIPLCGALMGGCVSAETRAAAKALALDTKILARDARPPQVGKDIDPDDGKPWTEEDSKEFEELKKHIAENSARVAEDLR